MSGAKYSGNIYGGDEVNAVVIDIGSYSVKTGFAGEDTPKGVFPTVVGCDYVDAGSLSAMDTTQDNSTITKKRPIYSIGTSRVTFPKEGREIRNPIKGGLVDDWDMIESTLEYCFKDCLQCESNDKPVMIIESAWNTKPHREKMTELLFEKFNVPAMYMVKSPVVSSFANGRGTSLVVDSGAEYTTVAPIYDGYVLTQGVRRSKLAGNYITEQFEHLLEKEYQIDIVPPVCIHEKISVEENETPKWKPKSSFPKVTESYMRYMKLEVIRDFQMSICRVSDKSFNEQSLSSIPTTHFEFPNGFNRNWGLERYKITEGLFNPQEFSLIPVEDEICTPPREELEHKPVESNSFSSLTPALFSRQAPSASTQTYATKSVGVQHLISEAITACDLDVQPSLWMNIILCGGNTLHQGYTERLGNEIRAIAPAGSRFKIMNAPSSQERMFSAWIGGSIYASLGTFQQLWISKMEYSDQGRGIVQKRCL